MKRLKRIYIAGRISGLSYHAVVKQFNEAEYFLRSLGFEVVNPVKIVPPGTGWTEAMRTCIAYLMACNYIAMLPGWKQSAGATIEYNIACGMEEEGKLVAIMHLAKEEVETDTMQDIADNARKLYPDYWDKEQLTEAILS